MSLEERIATLENENQVLKHSLQESLNTLQATLTQSPPLPTIARWQRRAWVLALTNLMLAMVLFTNVRFYTLEDLPPTLDPLVALWLRALWIALAFIWLALQLYPLALLFQAEEAPSQRLALRSALRMLTSSPAMIVSVSGFALLVALISAVLPELWLWFVGGLTILFGFIGLRSLLRVR